MLQILLFVVMLHEPLAVEDFEYCTEYSFYNNKLHVCITVADFIKGLRLSPASG